MKPKQGWKRSPTKPGPPEIRVAWKESRSYCGPYSVAYKGFYKLETLQNAVGKALQEHDRFLYSTLQSLLGKVSLGAVTCDLVYEDANRLVFTVMASNKARKQASVRLVMAKNHEECSAQLLAEYEILRELHKRAPEFVIEPCGHGIIYLPDRHHRRDVSREVFGYITKGAPGLRPLYVASNTQLAPHDLKPLRYSKKESEALKKAIIGLVAALYNERTATGVDIAGLYPECFVAGEGEKGAVRIVLMQCGKLRKRLYRRKLIHNLLFGVLKTGTTVFPVAPARPDHFYDALCDVVSKDTAQSWCQEFLSKSNAMRAHVHEELLPGRDYLDVLQELTNESES
ncbi:MAG: hypothetical protein KAH38_12635 [Candidatus Hydrogenedentes bacterium]|nr:hypothetical protein [Candidatus Hydrogenedentota bacterium]